MAAMAASRGTAARVGTSRGASRDGSDAGREDERARPRGEGDDDVEGRDDGRDGMTELTDAFAGWVERFPPPMLACRRGSAPAFVMGRERGRCERWTGWRRLGVNGSALGVSIAEATRASEEESQREVETSQDSAVAACSLVPRRKPSRTAVASENRIESKTRMICTRTKCRACTPTVRDGRAAGSILSEGMIALPLPRKFWVSRLAFATPNSLPRAALAVMDAPLTEGYSAFMLEQRLSLIDEAVAVLKDEDARRNTRTFARVFSPRSSPSARRRRSAYFKRLENTKPSWSLSTSSRSARTDVGIAEPLRSRWRARASTVTWRSWRTRRESPKGAN